MHRFVIALAAIVISFQAMAVAPQFWRVRTAEEFLAGELEGFAVTSRGELRVAPAVQKVASFTDPFVLSQATAPNGDRFFGTGNDGKVYRLRGETLSLLFTAPEPEIYAVAFHDGAVYAGSSPNGKVYRIDPEKGTGTAFFDPGQAYIWAITALAGGDLAVGTGVEGILYRVSRNGTGSVLYDSPDTHIRSIGVRADGTIIAGAAGKGRIYQISPAGSAHALFDSPLTEVTAIHVDSSGTAWAAAVSNVLPTAPPSPAQQQRSAQQQQQQQQQQGSGETKSESEAAAVEVTFSFEEPAAAVAQAGASEVYRIHTDGFVQTVRKFDREMVYAISGSPDAILLATGPNGRIYELRDTELSLVAVVPEKQVVSISTGSPSVITTTNAGAVYRMTARPTGSSEYRSIARDVDRFSRFGTYRIEGRNLGNGSVAVSFRSGNTRTPDATWSAWSDPQMALEGSVNAPAARYVQWKLTTSRPAADLAVENVTVAYLNRNIAPQIDSIIVQEPGVVFISSAYPAAPQLVEATNPDEYGIFSSLEPARDRAGDPGKRAFRKGYRTVSWRASDENGDPLRYSLSFRMKGTERWLRLRDNIEESQINFDTSQLPDGRYELRLTASDALGNPEGALTAVKEGIEFQIDNTAPTIAVMTGRDEVTIRITDAASPIGRVEYSIDAEKWIRMTPVDGIADSRDETFRLRASEVGGRFVVVRAVDTFFNVATEAVRLP